MDNVERKGANSFDEAFDNAINEMKEEFDKEGLKEKLLDNNHDNVKAFLNEVKELSLKYNAYILGGFFLIDAVGSVSDEGTAVAGGSFVMPGNPPKDPDDTFKKQYSCANAVMRTQLIDMITGNNDELRSLAEILHLKKMLDSFL